MPLPALPPGLTNVTEKGSYGRVNMELAATLWSSIDTLATNRSGILQYLNPDECVLVMFL